MGLSCGCDFDPEFHDWWSWGPDDYTTLDTIRSRKCCSCGERIEVGATVTQFNRVRSPKTDIEERFHGCEVPLAPWFMCEKCSDLFFSLEALGYCIQLGGSMEDALAEHHAIQKEA